MGSLSSFPLEPVDLHLSNKYRYVFDAATHIMLRELGGHDDAVRSLCRVGEHRIASGSSSGDGSIMVWKTR